MRHSELQMRDRENIHIYETGNGEPVIFLHGWSAAHNLTEPLMQLVGEKYRSVAWDARGHGHHAYHLTTPPTIDHLADDLKELIDYLGDEQVRLVGHSMGGAIVWAYLRKYGNARVKQIVIVDMTPKLTTDEDWQLGVYFDFPPERQQWLLNEMQTDIAEAVIRLRAYGRNAQTRAQYEANDPSLTPYRQFLCGLDGNALISIWQDLLDYDFRDFLATLTIPTLLVYGGASQFYGKPLADWMLKTLPNAELVFFPDGDHGPHIQYPQEVAAKMLTFFAAEPTATTK